VGHEGPDGLKNGVHGGGVPHAPANEAATPAAIHCRPTASVDHASHAPHIVATDRAYIDRRLSDEGKNGSCVAGTSGDFNAQRACIVPIGKYLPMPIRHAYLEATVSATRHPAPWSNELRIEL
jgi:hypothetical protein